LSCAPGLPQTPEAQISGGFRQRFQNGAIYRNVSANRTIWLFGAIYTEYKHKNEGGGVLGLPISKITAISGAAGCDQQQCQKARFDHGFIYFKTDTGAHELHGAVLDYFVSQNGVLGHLGFPKTDVRSTSTGTEATFEGGVVSCTKDGSCSDSSSGS
jgi:uncharacterized protein with LGFP repeats